MHRKPSFVIRNVDANIFMSLECSLQAVESACTHTVAVHLLHSMQIALSFRFESNKTVLVYCIAFGRLMFR